MTTVVVAGMLCAGLTACAGTDRVAGDGRNVGAALGTFPRSAAGGGTTILAVNLRKELLRVDEMRSIVSFGFDTREQPVLDPKQFALTTLRGPCGATVKTPFRADGGFKVFRSTVTLIIESVAEPGVSDAAAFLDALKVDATTGCPAFEEQLGAAPSMVQTKGLLNLPALGDQRIGWGQTVTAADARVGYRYIVAIRGGPRVLLLAVLATKAIDAAALDDLATRAAKG